MSSRDSANRDNRANRDKQELRSGDKPGKSGKSRRSSAPVSAGTNQAKAGSAAPANSGTGGTAGARRPQEMTSDERMAALKEYGEKHRADIRDAERKASSTVIIDRQLPFLALGMVGVLMSIFLPHSGSVHGYDVLFFTAEAKAMVTTWPERIYLWLALIGGVLLPVGTIVSRSTLVAWVNWFFSGIGWVYAIFAIWMRQSRPPTEPGSGPSYGLIIGAVSIVIVFITVSTMVFHRSVLQRVLESVRREEANRDDESRLAQQRLRTGLSETEQKYYPVDDRRARAKQRARRVAEERSGGSKSRQEQRSE